MYATKIKMKPGCYNSSNLLEIDSFYIEGCNIPESIRRHAFMII